VAREPVQIPDIQNDPECSYGGPREGDRSLIAVPIMVEDDLIGVVVLIRSELQPFTDEHIALVQTFADQAAIASANARLFEAVERQRTKLARFVARNWQSRLCRARRLVIE
jgi:two-component system, NtrC family, sensor kinase